MTKISTLPSVLTWHQVSNHSVAYLVNHTSRFSAHHPLTRCYFLFMALTLSLSCPRQLHQTPISLSPSPRPAFLMLIPDFSKLGSATHHSRLVVRRSGMWQGPEQFASKWQRNRDHFPQPWLNSWLRPEGDGWVPQPPTITCLKQVNN